MDVLSRLPLMEAFWRLWQEVFPEEYLNELYDQHRGRCYQKEFSFAELVSLVHDAMGQHEGRAKATLDRHELPASIQAFYGKLRRMPVVVSQTLVSEGSQRLAGWLPAETHAPVPACFQEHPLLIFDGKILKNAAKRLKQTRAQAGAALGGKALGVLDYQTGLILGMEPHQDAYHGEQLLVQPLLDQLRPQIAGQRIWVMDQHFGNLCNFARCTQHGDHVIVRQHTNTVFTADSSRPARSGVDEQGRTYDDEVGMLTSSRQGAQPARHITVKRPGDDDLVLLTSLLDQDAYPATAILAVYGFRWSIEEVYQKVVELFHLQRLIGSHPLAMIFQASLCLTLYNVMTVLRCLLAQTQKRQTAEISMYQVNYDLHRQLTTSHTLMTPQDILAEMKQRQPLGQNQNQRQKHILSLLEQAWHPRWIKAPNKKTHLPKPRHKNGQAGHFSIDRVLRKSRDDDV